MNEEETILTNVSPKTFNGFKNKNNSITIPKGINSLKATLSNKPKTYSTLNEYQTSTKNNLEITQQTNVFNQSTSTQTSITTPTTTNVSTSSEVSSEMVTAVATTNKVSVSTVTKPTATKPKLR